MRQAILRPQLALTALVSAAVLAMPAVAQSRPVVPPRPVPGPARAFVFPTVTVQTLRNGLRLAVVENHEMPIVSVRVGFLGGPYLDAPGKEGGWALMLAALREGTMMRSSAELAAAAADLGTTIVWDPVVQSPSNGAPSFTTIKAAWRPTLQLVAEMLMYPSFPSDAVSRIQAAQATAAARPAQSVVALRLATQLLFGGDHLYTRTFAASDSSLRQVTHDDVVGMHAAYIRPQTTVIVVAGDVTPAEARAAVDEAFTGWQRTEKTVDISPAPPAAPPATTTIYLRDFPGATQSFINRGLVLPNRGSPDASAIEAVNAILGGASSGSRMFEALRDNRGLSYNPVSVIQWKPEPQPATWLQTAIVPTDKTDTAVVELVRLLHDARGDRPLTQAELDFSRRNLVGTLPTQMETISAQASAALTLLKNGLPTTFYADYVTRMNSLTLADVQAAASKYIDPEHLTIVVVGDRAKLEAPLRATGIPVVIVDR